MGWLCLVLGHKPRRLAHLAGYSVLRRGPRLQEQDIMLNPCARCGVLCLDPSTDEEPDGSYIVRQPGVVA